MLLRRRGVGEGRQAPQVALRCPACRQLGIFTFPSQEGGDFRFYGDGKPYRTGQRFCPDDKCKAHVFVVLDDGGELLISYPAETIDFDSSRIPPNIVESFSEAITCHAHHRHVAAAIMVRKTLELLCAAQSAQGKNLKEKLKALQSKVTLPPPLIAGLDDIRLLGNDAAHVESDAFVQVSQQELDVAIELTKEVLKGVYQYEDLLQKIKALKRPTA
jgi:hypothetical protein